MHVQQSTIQVQPNKLESSRNDSHVWVGEWANRHETFDNLCFDSPIKYLDSRILAIDIDQLTRILWLCGKPEDEFLSKVSSEEVSRKALFYSINSFFFFYFLAS